MIESSFYHEDLVIFLDETNHMIHCGHIEGEALHDFGVNTDISSLETVPNRSSSENQIIAPNQFGDKSSDHDDTIDSMFIEADNQFETGYFEGPFRGNVFVRWNSMYYQNILEMINPIANFEDSIPGQILIKLDRYHQLSDVVKNNSLNKLGVITKIKKKAYGEIIGTNRLLADISCSKFKSVEKFFPGTSEQLVVYNSWLGRVASILRDIVLKFPDGAKIRTSELSIENFEPLFNGNLSDVIFRGSALKGDVRDLKNKSSKFIQETRIINSNWLRQLHNPQNMEVMIIKVIIVSVKVDWLMFKPKLEEENIISDTPPSIIRGSNIQKIKSINSCPFIYCYTDDIWYYQLKAGDKLYNISQCCTPKLLYKIFKKENIKQYKSYIKPVKQKKKSDKKTETVTVKKSSLKSNKVISLKNKVLNENKSNQMNHNSIYDMLKDRKSMKSIYKHLQGHFSCNKTINKSFSFHKENQNKRRQFFHERAIKYRNYSNKETHTATLNSKSKANDGHNKKLLASTNPSKQTNRKVINKKTLNQMKITQEMIIKYFNNFKPDTWVPVQILLIESLIDITWQDGTISQNVPGMSVTPEMFEIDEYDFFPGDFVSMKPGLEENKINENLDLINNFGCVLKAANDQRIVSVQWFKNLKEKGLIKKGKLETCGSYDIKHHKNHHYHIGDIVGISNFCMKTNFPAGFVTSVQPTKGRLTIKWHNAKETLLYPSDLSGVVWDLVSDDLFSTTDDSLDISTLNIHDTEKIHEIIANINRDTLCTNAAYSVIISLLECLSKLKSVIDSNKVEYKNYACDLMNEIKSLMTEFKKFPDDKTLQFLYDSYFSSLFEENTDVRFSNYENKDKQIIPTTSKLNSFTEKKSEIMNDQIDKKISKSKISDTDKIEGNVMINQFNMDKILHMQKSLSNWMKIKVMNENIADSSNQICKISLQNPSPEMNYISEYPNLLESTINRTNTRKLTSEPGTSWSIDNPRSNSFNLNKENEHTSTVETRNQQSSMNETQEVSLYSPLSLDQRGYFEILSSGFELNKFGKQFFSTTTTHDFHKAWTQDYNLLTTSLPRGIWVKNFEERIDLFSVMIEGPESTPYEFSLFFFDVYLPTDYPKQPPLVYYHSITADRVNPNLYPDGRVCLSLLGTWIGRGNENWNPTFSNLLQLIISLQGLILVSEPYFNEAGYEGKRNSEEGATNSKKYNESVITSLVVTVNKLIENPLETFQDEIKSYYKENGKKYLRLLTFWTGLDESTYKSYLNYYGVTAEDTKSQAILATNIYLPNSTTILKTGTREITKILSIDNIQRTNIKGVDNDIDDDSESDTIVPNRNVTKNKANFRLHQLILPQFSLAPVSQGFSLTMKKYIGVLDKTIQSKIL